MEDLATVEKQLILAYRSAGRWGKAYLLKTADSLAGSGQKGKADQRTQETATA